MAITIRDFRPGDFEELWRMDQQCFPAGISYSKPELRAYIRHRGGFTLVAEDAERDSIRGFIVAHSGTSGHIVTIDVSPGGAGPASGRCCCERRKIA